MNNPSVSVIKLPFNAKVSKKQVSSIVPASGMSKILVSSLLFSSLLSLRNIKSTQACHVATSQLLGNFCGETSGQSNFEKNT